MTPTPSFIILIIMTNQINKNNDEFFSSNPVPYRTLLSRLTEGVAILVKGRMIYANAALCEMVGKNRGEIIGCKFLDLVPDDDRRLVMEYLRQIEIASPGSIDFRLHRSASAGRWVRLRTFSVALKGIYTGTTGICCSVTDITTLQDRIVELQRDNRRLRSHIDDTESVLMSTAPYDCNDILMINRYVEALLGCSVKDIISGRRHLFDFVHPDHRAQVIDFYNGFPEGHENAEMEYMIIRNDRQIRWVRDMGNTLYVERGHGMPSRIDHTLVDITEQKTREIELREERRKLSSIIKNSTDTIFRVNRAGNFLDLNPAGKQLLGVKGDLGSLNIMDFYVDLRQREQVLNQLDEKGFAQKLVKWKVADNQVIDVVINAVVEKNTPGDMPTYQGIVHNVTRTLELQKVDTIKKITSGLSDRINTPLMTLSFNMAMLREALNSGAHDKAEMRQCLDEMEEAYRKITGPMAVVRDKHWQIHEVSDGSGGTLYEIREKK